MVGMSKKSQRRHREEMRELQKARRAGHYPKVSDKKDRSAFASNTRSTAYQYVQHLIAKRREEAQRAAELEMQRANRIQRRWRQY